MKLLEKTSKFDSLQTGGILLSEQVTPLTDKQKEALAENEQLRLEMNRLRKYGVFFDRIVAAIDNV